MKYDNEIDKAVQETIQLLNSLRGEEDSEGKFRMGFKKIEVRFTGSPTAHTIFLEDVYARMREENKKHEPTPPTPPTDQEFLESIFSQK